MKEITELYQQMGISPAVYAYGEEAISRLRDRFDTIDKIFVVYVTMARSTTICIRQYQNTEFI